MAQGRQTPPPAVADDTKTALAILQRAMGMESIGQQFYLRAAETTLDAKGQVTFRNLADDEQSHFEIVKRQFDALTGMGKWAPSPDIKPPNADLAASLFPTGKDGTDKRINVKSSEWDALLFGIDIEVKSYDFYRRAALEVLDPVGKQTFEFLAGQEQGHFDTLMLRYDYLYGPMAWYP